jgi:hypothetical protein
VLFAVDIQIRRERNRAFAQLVLRPHMIFNHYREIVTPEEAERYWQIFPPRPAQNVVPI